MPFNVPLRRDRQTPRSSTRSRSNTPSTGFTPVHSTHPSPSPSPVPPNSLSYPHPASNSPSSGSSRTGSFNPARRPSLGITTSNSATSTGNLNGPQRNVSTSSNVSSASGHSTTTSTSGASSTSSLEAVPMRPSAGTRMGMVEGIGRGGRSGEKAGLGDNQDGGEEERRKWNGNRRGSNDRNGNGNGSASGFIVLSRGGGGAGGQGQPRTPTTMYRQDTLSPSSADNNKKLEHDLSQTTIRLKQNTVNSTSDSSSPSAYPNGVSNSSPALWTDSPSSSSADLVHPRPHPFVVSPGEERSDWLTNGHRPISGVGSVSASAGTTGRERPTSQLTAKQNIFPSSHSSSPPRHNTSNSTIPPPSPSASSTVLPTATTTQQRLVSNQISHLFLPSEMRPSSSGPDLTALRRERERSRKVGVGGGGDADGDDADVDGEGRKGNGNGNGSGAMGLGGMRPKLRTRSSSAQATHMERSASTPSPPGASNDSGVGSSTGIGIPGPSPRPEPRKAVTLQDFTFGSILGRGSYSVVVLATQNSNGLPYAVKILDQQQLLQEKKTKYAKVERDALIRLGPRAPPPPLNTVSANGFLINGNGLQKAGRNWDRRGSAVSAGSSRSSGAGTGTSGSASGSATTRMRREVTDQGMKRRRPSTGTITGGGNEVGGNGGGNGTMDREATLQPGWMDMRRGSIAEIASPDEKEAEGGNDRPVISLNEDAPALANGKERSSQQSEFSRSTIPNSESGSTISAPSPTTPSFVIPPLRLQTVNLPVPSRHDESAVALSPDSLKSTYSNGVGNMATGSRRKSVGSEGRSVDGKRKKMSHSGVVRLHYTFKDDTSLYFVLDLAINGELLSLIKKHGSLDLNTARTYAAQVIDTIDFMHERGVIHRDLKPENILLDDDMRIKITDFGSAKVMDPETKQPVLENGEDSKKRSFVGTAEYVSPEVLQNEHATMASDIWAFGCILFQMIAGRPPFRGGTEYLTFQKVLKAEYEFPEGFDELARNLVESVLKIDPTARPSVETIKSHPFFTLPSALTSPSNPPSPIDFTSTSTFNYTIWTSPMPPLLPGLVPPPPPIIRQDLSRHGWSDFLGHDDLSPTSGGESTSDGLDGDDGLEDGEIDEEEEAERRFMAGAAREIGVGTSNSTFGRYQMPRSDNSFEGKNATPHQDLPVAAQFPEHSASNPQQQPRSTGDGSFIPRLNFPSSSSGHSSAVRTPHSGAGSSTFTSKRSASGGGGTDDDLSLIGVGTGGSGSGGSGSVESGGNAKERRGSEAASTVKMGHIADDGNNREPIDKSREPGSINLPLLPNERILHSSPISYRSQSPSSLFLPQVKKRRLVLTDLPRLICVKEDLESSKGQRRGKDTAHSGERGQGQLEMRVKIKAECLFGRAALDLDSQQRSSTTSVTQKDSLRRDGESEKERKMQGERVRRTVVKVWEKGEKGFVVQTPEKDHTFMTDSEEFRARWTEEISKVQEREETRRREGR